MKVISLMFFVMCVSACGSNSDSVTGGSVVVNTAEQQDVASLVADENTYRTGLGQTALTSGLSCTLYTTTGGDRIQASIAGHNTLSGLTQVATFLLKTKIEQPDSSVNQTLNLLPVALRPTYTNMYLLRCQGQVVITNTNYVPFELTSDDGSVLYVDGAKVIDNDNAHGATLVQGNKYLRRGVHTIRLDFAQTGGGNQALILTSGGLSIDTLYMFH